MRSSIYSVKIFCGMAVTLAIAVCCQVSLAQIEGRGAIVAIDEAAGASGSQAKDNSGGKGEARTFGTKGVKKGSVKGTGSKGSPTKSPAPVMPSVSSKVWNGPVLGDKYTFLNFEVVSAAKPTHTIKAKQAGASGLVQVEVLIDERGNVISAKARTGNKLLWDEAERAALASKFNRPTDNGRPARATGFLVYRFGKAEDEDDY